MDRSFRLGSIFFTASYAVLWAWALLGATSELHQGDVYRILYLHVPAAFSAFLSSFFLLVFSILALRRPDRKYLSWAKATSEVGFLFTLITLLTGSIWGRPTWGVWWTWDARLTTTFLLMLLYAGYLLTHAAFDPGPLRTKACSILGILICADVPIIYKSVTWWRTLHQPPSMFRAQGSTMAPEILQTLTMAIILMLAFAFWLIYERRKNLDLLGELEVQTNQGIL